MTSYEDFKAELLKNPKIKKEYVALEPEFQVIAAMVTARISENLTQQQLADRTGINRADISKLENGSANPSIKTLQRLAAGMGKKIKIEFLPL